MSSEPSQHLLARCPFCNGHELTADITENTWEHTFRIRCFDCGACGPRSLRDLEGAVALWNAGLDGGTSLIYFLDQGIPEDSNRNDRKKVDL